MTMQQSAGGATGALTFGDTVKAGPYVRLGLKNALLCIVTFGVYFFWARTAARRQLWFDTRINGAPLSYVGTGLDLFIGVIALQVCLAVAMLPLQIAIMRDPGFWIIPIMVLVELGLLVGAYGVMFLGYRYKAGRTRWRETPLRLEGGALNFALAMSGWSLLCIITAGWAAPAAFKAFFSRTIGGLRFGDVPITWAPPAKGGLYGPFALGWMVSFAGLIVVGLFFTVLSSMFNGSDSQKLGAILVIYMVLIVVSVICVAGFILFAAALIRFVVRATQVEGARFELDAGLGAISLLLLTNLLLVVFTCGVLIPLARARAMKFITERLRSTGEAPGLYAQAPTPVTEPTLLQRMGSAYV